MSGKPVTKTPATPEAVTKAKGGRPRKAEPLSAAERQRRSRAAKAKAAKARPPRSADEVYAALVEQRGITSPFDLALARECVDALCRGDLAEAVRALGLLPVTRSSETASNPTTEALSAKQHVMALIFSALEGERVQRARRCEMGRGSERDRLLVRVDEIDSGEPAALAKVTEPVVASEIEQAGDGRGRFREHQDRQGPHR